MRDCNEIKGGVWLLEFGRLNDKNDFNMLRWEWYHLLWLENDLIVNIEHRRIRGVSDPRNISKGSGLELGIAAWGEI